MNDSSKLTINSSAGVAAAESRLIVEPPQLEGDLVEVAARLECGGDSHRIWWRLPASWRHALTTWADPYVIAFLFPLMQRGGTVRVAGTVSPSLLANLETFMAVWSAWLPERYRPVRIRAEEEAESPPPRSPPPVASGTLISFSGGVDSCYTAWRHTRGREALGHRARSVSAGVIIQGMDIRLDDPRTASRYAAARDGAQQMLESLGLACIPIICNFREIPSDSRDSHITLLVSCARLLGGTFDAVLIPNTLACHQLDTRWGSHPLTDPFLGGMHFPVADDGVERTRSEKLRELGGWPEAMRYMRVCFGGAEGGVGNCCRCEKCIRTILACRIAGIPRPASFPQDVSDEQIRSVRFHGDIIYRYWKELARDIKLYQVPDASWIRAMNNPMRRHERHQARGHRKRPLATVKTMLRTIIGRAPSPPAPGPAATPSENA